MSLIKLHSGAKSPEGHMFYIGLYRENIKNLKSLDITDVASSSEPLPKGLFHGMGN